jgi:cell division initiation protein
MDMVTAHDVHTVTFEKTMRGYSVNQVDDFLDRIADQLEQDEARAAELTKNCEAMQAKLAEQAKKLEGYTSYEDALKAALLNAQRMGENVIREAKQKSDALVREASIRADDITRAAESKKAEQEIELERIRGEVAQFKSNVLSLYKSHIESLSTLPDADQEAADAAPEAQAQDTADAAPAAPETKADPEPEAVHPAEPEVPESPLAQGAAAPAAQNDSDSFWEQDEHDLTAPADDLAQTKRFDPQTAKPEEPETHADTFRGISFSD